jgi:hypothetical protein
VEVEVEGEKDGDGVYDLDAELPKEAIRKKKKKEEEGNR